LCDRVAIIATPGRLVWTGDVTPLATGQSVEWQGRRFDSLESLYLACAGRSSAALEWV